VVSRDFGFIVVSMFTALLAVGCGIPFAIIALVQMASRPEGAKPSAILSFAATIPLNAAAVLSFAWLPKDLANRMILGVNGYDLVLSLLLFTSFVLWLITLGLLYGYAGGGKRALKSGSIGLLSLYALGCIGRFAS
jgi:hypothetical protein